MSSVSSFNSSAPEPAIASHTLSPATPGNRVKAGAVCPPGSGDQSSVDSLSAVEKPAEALAASGNPPRVLRVVSSALREGNRSERWNDWACVAFSSGDPNMAESGFRHALRLEPTHRRAALNLATLLLEERQEPIVMILSSQGKPTEQEAQSFGALASPQRAQLGSQVTPGEWSAVAKQAAGLMVSGNFSKALLVLTSALRESQRSELWNDWACASYGRGDSALAESGFRRALQLRPTYRQAALNLATLLLKQGKIQAITMQLSPRGWLIEQETQNFRVRATPLQTAPQRRNTRTAGMGTIRLSGQDGSLAVR